MQQSLNAIQLRPYSVILRSPALNEWDGEPLWHFAQRPSKNWLNRITMLAILRTDRKVLMCIHQRRSVQFSCSVVSNCLWPHRLQHSRLPCPSPTPRVYSNSCPLSWWYHPTISSSLVPFSSCLQSFSASGYFPMSQFFASSGQSIGVSASTSALPMNIQDCFLQDGLVWSPCSPRDSHESPPTPQFKSINSLELSFLYSLTFTSMMD